MSSKKKNLNRGGATGFATCLTKKEVIDMKKRKVIILSSIAFFVVVVIVCLMVSASVDYKIMSYTEKIKSQIKEEQQVYSDTIFDQVIVIRPWYSLNPTTWDYHVMLKDNGEVQIYKYDNGVFIQVD